MAWTSFPLDMSACELTAATTDAPTTPAYDYSDIWDGYSKWKDTTPADADDDGHEVVTRGKRDTHFPLPLPITHPEGWRMGEIRQVVNNAEKLALQRLTSNDPAMVGKNITASQIRAAASALHRVVDVAYRGGSQKNVYWGAPGMAGTNTAIILPCQGCEYPTQATRLILPAWSDQPGWYCIACAGKPKHKVVVG